MALDFHSPIIFYGIILYLLSFIIEGPIRYVLHMAGVEFLIYFRDLFLIAVLLTYMLKALISGRIHKLMMLTFFLIFFHTIIGILYIKNILQVLFGLKTLMPIIVGMLAYPSFSSRPKTVRYLFLTFFSVAVLGVLLNIFNTFPWEGMEYQLAGQEIKGTRVWSSFGLKRIGGFSRSSIDTSIQILVLSIYLISHLERKMIAALLWLIAGLALLATTQKGIIFAYIFLSLFFIIYKIVPNFYNFYQKMLIVPIIIAVLLPVCGYVFHYQLWALDILKSPLLVTFRDRVVNAWPDDLAFLQKQGDFILGRGIGGIGMGQHFFEKQYMSPADNMFIFALFFFGIISIAYLLYIYKLAQKIDINDNLYYYLLLLALILFGIVANCFESSFLMIFFGISLRYLWIKNLEKKMAYSFMRC